jgi:hypothetical protein
MFYINAVPITAVRSPLLGEELQAARMPWWALPLVAVLAVVGASSSGPSSASAHGSLAVLDPEAVHDCFFRSRENVTAELGDDWERKRCHRACPRLPPPAEEQQCSEYHHERPGATHHAGVHFAILFLALCLLLGGISRLCIPWMPYTVTLLLLGFLLGGLAFVLESQVECPLNALYKFDRDGDERISRAEWSEFICVGCDPDSVCASRSCGDGSSAPADCRYTFDSLDTVFRISPMYVSWVNHTAGDGCVCSHRPQSCHLSPFHSSLTPLFTLRMRLAHGSWQLPFAGRDVVVPLQSHD